VEFPPSDTLTSFPTPGCWACTPAPTRGSPARPACLFTVLRRIPFSQFSVLSVPHPLSCVSLLLLLLITQFLFSPWVEVGLSRGLCCSGPGLSVGVPRTPKLTWSASSQAIWAPATGGQGALLVSPFNVKWRFSALAGGVEGSKLCLFSVIMPAKCVSSVSPRFHYRRLTFCFLPLAAIFESCNGTFYCCPFICTFVYLRRNYCLSFFLFLRAYAIIVTEVVSTMQFVLNIK
jgi:hypothetical protein